MKVQYSPWLNKLRCTGPTGEMPDIAAVDFGPWHAVSHRFKEP